MPQQRLDLPDFRNIEDFVCADFKSQFKNIWTGENFVLKGFDSIGLGTNELTIAIAGSALIVGSDDGTMFIGAPSVADAVTDALTPAATNYVEISIEQDTGGADSRAFWDPTAAAGQGGEFSQIVDTFIFIKVQLNINTSNFTGAPDMVPVCEVDVNGSGIITDIRDARNLFWRLGRRGQPNFTFPWVSRTEPPTSQFDGADKDIDTEKKWKDAVMSRILELDGGNFWFENSGVSLVGGFRNTGLSMVTSQSTDAKWSWDGSDLILTDSSGVPLATDVVAALRLLDSTADLLLTRQDGQDSSAPFTLADGDVLWVELPDPLANVNYNAIGLTASNFRVSPRGSVPNDSNTFWLAYRDGANVYLRFFGELQPGEDVEISDNVNENILAAIGIATETDMPNYTSNNYVVDGTSLVEAVSALDAAAGLSSIGADQDRSLKLIEGGTWSVNFAGDTLAWSADAFIDVPEVTRVSNRILSGNVVLPNPDSVAYVQINRASGPASLTVNVADIDAIPADGDTVIIARRTTTGILVGRACFLLKAGEYLELDGALAEINRKLGQLKLRPHESAADKARIDAADINQLDSSILSQIIGDFLLKFDGAVINFTTGVINAADDITPLGIDFTPFTIPVGEYFWYGVSLIPGNVLADNTQEAQVQIDLAAASDAAAATAVKPVITGDIKLGAIQVFNNAGNIEIFETRKLGVGSGSGSGSGDANAVDTALRDRFALNNFLFLTENVFRTDKVTKVDMSSTGEFSPAKKAFGFTAAAQTMVSTQHLDSDFLDDGIDVSEVELYLFWLAGFIDTAAIYEVSRDGGTNWQTAAMERIGETNAYRVHHTFTDEVTQQSLALVAPTGAGTALNATTAQQLSSELVISDTAVLKFLNLELNYGGAGVGNLFVQIVKDDTGVPSTDPSDIVSESDAISIADLASGDITLSVDMPDVTLIPDTYHVVLRTDAGYKAGTLDLSWREGAGTDGAAYDGSVWTGGASTKAFEAEGRALDLRVRVTSSAGDVFIEGYGIYYDSSLGIQPSSTRKIQKFVFSGDDNLTDFTCNFEIDPYIVSVYVPRRGQVYVPDTEADSALRIDGNTLKFATDTFDFPGETIVLIVRQLEGNGVDVSQENAQKIFELQQDLDNLENLNKNYAQNAEFRFYQRQDPVGTVNRADDTYGPDRMIMLCSGGSDFQPQRQSNDNPTQSPTRYSGRFRQANAVAQQVGVVQVLEADRVWELRGKTVTFAFWARTDGSEVPNIRASLLEWDGTADAVTSDVVSAWSATPTLAANWTSVNTPSDLALDGTWKQFTITVTLGQTFTNLAWFIWTPAAVAQNGDLYLSQIQIVRGSGAKPWSKVSLSKEADKSECLRFYEKSYNEDIPPAAITTDSTFSAHSNSSGTLNLHPTVYFKEPKRINSAVTFYSPVTGSTGVIRDTSTGTDRATVAIQNGHNMMVLNITSVPAESLCLGHFTAEGEL